MIKLIRGTGKTTLCRALSQKLSIRLLSRYPTAVLVQINAHALFSKFFAESAKLVLRVFKTLHMRLDEGGFVCVVMGMKIIYVDEVESLTAARQAAISGNEPADSIRVVNCLLTQIDRLKARGNVLVLATSNITAAIDVAFLDRADLIVRMKLT